MPNKTKFDIKHPMLQRLFEINGEFCELYPEETPVGPIKTGLGQVGIFMPDKSTMELASDDYWCDPQNAAMFAWTGCDGHHFSLLAVDRTVKEDAPVVMIRPDYSDQPAMIVGENLWEFLSLGMHCGFFGLLRRGFSKDLHATETMLEDLSEVERRMLQRLADEFRLKPWRANGQVRLKKLQSLLSQFQFDPDFP